ncbi:MAG: SDR family NAD(P)-dependent oxidoreductase [Pirellulales bacterium]|nr:SDR family NAD(P)-dependent oxidoreductase [Pirellulales bacterium]
MSGDWADKVVLVTGASSGLGFSIAEAFAARRARIVLAARGAESLEVAAQKLRERGAVVGCLPTDVTSAAQCATLVQYALDQFGRLDVLVNNAGRSARGELLKTTPEQFRELLELNFLGVVHCTQAAAGELLARQGHVVNIGSLAAKSAARLLGAYPVSKFALAAYTQQLRLELGPQGLHVMLVCPGPVAREPPRERPADELAGLPPSAALPGGGVKAKAIPPAWLAEAIVRGCERRRLELVVPAKARLLFALSQLSPRLGDYLVARMTG